MRVYVQVAEQANLEMLQLGLKGVVGPGKGLQNVPQGMLPTAPGSCDVVEVVLESRNFFFRQCHALLEPAHTPKERWSFATGKKGEQREVCLGGVGGGGGLLWGMGRRGLGRGQGRAG